MIIDTNASLGNWPFRMLRYNDPAGLVERLGRADIQQAWVASVEAPLLTDAHTLNEPLAEQVVEFPGLLPVAAINPTLPPWERDLAWCVEDLGFRGIRLHPNFNGYTLADPLFAAVLEAAQDLSVFVSVAVRMSDERHHHARCMVPPVDLKPLPEALAAHPQARVLLINANWGDIAPINLAVAQAQKLWVELSHFETVGGVEKMVRDMGRERVVFGTHAPHYYPESSLLKVFQESDLAEEDRAAIVHGNAEALLGA